MKIISFSGLDGAGKSTQISLLRDFLEGNGKRVVVLTMYDDVSFSAFIRRSFRKKKGDLNDSPDAGGQTGSSGFRLDKNYFSFSRFALRMVVYLLDVVRLWVRVWRVSDKADVIIFDRYIYDSLVNLLCHSRNWFVLWYVRFVLFVAPRVDVPIFLSVDANEAFNRKPEYPLDYMRNRAEAYGFLFDRFVKNGLSVAGSIDEVAGKIRFLVGKF